MSSHKERVEMGSWEGCPAVPVPGQIVIDGKAGNPYHRSVLQKRAYEFLLSHRDILRGARRARQDIVAMTQEKHNVLMIGAGVIGVVGALAGVLIIYPRWKARQQRSMEKK